MNRRIPFNKKNLISLINIHVDHAFIVAGGEITKSAKNWLGGKLDATKRRQIMFIDREDILDSFIVNNLPLPPSALSQSVIDEKDGLPF